MIPCTQISPLPLLYTCTDFLALELVAVKCKFPKCQSRHTSNLFFWEGGAKRKQSTIPTIYVLALLRRTTTFHNCKPPGSLAWWLLYLSQRAFLQQLLRLPSLPCAHTTLTHSLLVGEQELFSLLWVPKKTTINRSCLPSSFNLGIFFPITQSALLQPQKSKSYRCTCKLA